MSPAAPATTAQSVACSAPSTTRMLTWAESTRPSTPETSGTSRARQRTAAPGSRLLPSAVRSGTCTIRAEPRASFSPPRPPSSARTSHGEPTTTRCACPREVRRCPPALGKGRVSTAATTRARQPTDVPTTRARIQIWSTTGATITARCRSRAPVAESWREP
jgi:hypothetical protein